MRAPLCLLLLLVACGPELAVEPPAPPPEQPMDEAPPETSGGVAADVTEPDPTDVTLVPDPKQLAIVDAGARDAGTPPPVDAGAPRAKLLDTSFTATISEPPGSGNDNNGTYYVDKNYWNFCVPGAVTTALYYFKPHNVTAWPAGRFLEPANAPSTIPSGGTYWNSTKGRAYLMHLAMDVKPPTWATAGIDNFSTYPTTGGRLTKARDALNWEASGHAASWASFFYVVVTSGSVTQTTLHDHVKQDIAGGHAVVIFADTGYLPNWTRSLSHAITIVGYDDAASTYTYLDTCGKRCNGSAISKNGGTWTIMQSKMTQAVQHGAGYIW